MGVMTEKEVVLLGRLRDCCCCCCCVIAAGFMEENKKTVSRGFVVLLQKSFIWRKI